MLTMSKPSLDRPFEPGEQDRRAARVAGSEHAHARQLALRRERADDPGAGRAVAAEVAAVVVGDVDLVALLRHGRPSAAPRRPADGRARCRCRGRRRAPPRPVAPPKRPLAGDALGPRRGEVDRFARRGGQAPGGKLLVGLVREHCHGPILRIASARGRDRNRRAARRALPQRRPGGLERARRALLAVRLRDLRAGLPAAARGRGGRLPGGLRARLPASRPAAERRRDPAVDRAAHPPALHRPAPELRPEGPASSTTSTRAASTRRSRGSTTR